MDTIPEFEEKKPEDKVIVISQRKEVSWENYIWNCKDKIVYGPILSRRLGRSLGINLFPSKLNACTFDCIYCDCGPTRKDTYNFASVQNIKDELVRSFKHHSVNKTPIDYITFAGNGEPTYYPFFPEIVNFVLKLRDKFFPQTPLAMFSNGTMIFKQEVIESIAKLDERIFKLDAGDERTFSLINRSNNTFSLKQLVDGLAKLKDIKISSAVLCSEVSNFGSLKASGYIDALKRINPIEVHLYSIDYPPAYQGVRRARISKMLELAHYIATNMNVKIKVLQARKAR